MGAARPHNPAARGEPLGATAPCRNRSQTKNNKPALNTKLRILPSHPLSSQDLNVYACPPPSAHRKAASSPPLSSPKLPIAESPRHEPSAAPLSSQCPGRLRPHSRHLLLPTILRRHLPCVIRRYLQRAP